MTAIDIIICYLIAGFLVAAVIAIFFNKWTMTILGRTRRCPMALGLAIVCLTWPYVILAAKLEEVEEDNWPAP